MLYFHINVSILVIVPKILHIWKSILTLRLFQHPGISKLTIIWYLYLLWELKDNHSITTHSVDSCNRSITISCLYLLNILYFNDTLFLWIILSHLNDYNFILLLFFLFNNYFKSTSFDNKINILGQNWPIRVVCKYDIEFNLIEASVWKVSCLYLK